MGRHWAYLKYVIRHKWFMFLASIKIGAPFLRALFHDLSKFKSNEWFPYARTFYKPDGTGQYNDTIEYRRAWNDHQKKNKHHWQYWVLRMDNGNEVALDIPYNYVLEMVADWMGAGRAIHGKWEILDWYGKNKENMIFSKTTRKNIDYLMKKLDMWGIK